MLTITQIQISNQIYKGKFLSNKMEKIIRKMMEHKKGKQLLERKA